MNMLPKSSWGRREDGLLNVKTDGSDWTRWLVQSDTRADTEHLVDLTDFPIENDCNGSCTCEAFTLSMQKTVEAGLTGGLPLRCKHIDRAREALVGAVLEHERKRRNWKLKK